MENADGWHTHTAPAGDWTRQGLPLDQSINIVHWTRVGCRRLQYAASLTIKHVDTSMNILSVASNGKCTPNSCGCRLPACCCTISPRLSIQSPFVRLRARYPFRHRCRIRPPLAKWSEIIWWFFDFRTHTHTHKRQYPHRNTQDMSLLVCLHGAFECNRIHLAYFDIFSTISVDFSHTQTPLIPPEATENKHTEINKHTMCTWDGGKVARLS